MLNRFFLLAKKKLFHLNRSITGKDTKLTLDIIKKNLKNLKIRKVKSNTKVFDWKIPDEWNVESAYVLDKSKKKIIDFKNNNLHLVGYSKKIKKKISKKNLLKKIYTLSSLPNAIPYKTSYYKRDWGFCISHNQKKKIIKNYNLNDKFFVNIKSSHKKNGSLHYGELILQGKSNIELIISTYICHPSMANNELSGPIVSMALANYFKKKTLKYTLRFLFIPETIGSIYFIKKNFTQLKNKQVFGLNLSCIGDERNYSMMYSKFEDSPIDEAILEAYKKLNIKPKKFSFLKRGSDERQFNSPGVDIPMASLFRTKYGEYPEYHSSMDNFDIVTYKGLMGGFKIAKKTIEIFQKKIIPFNKILCEPQLGKRNLYPKLSSNKIDLKSRRYLDFLQYADGKSSIEKIADHIKIKYKDVFDIHKILTKNKII
jgi:aminopeptidase-like protein